MKLCDTEWRVMQSLWNQSPSTARQIHEDVCPETGWAYNTVRTILTRLVEKGAVQVRKQGGQGVYSPALSRLHARRDALQSLLERAFDGTFGSLIQHLVERERLTEADRRQIGQMLRELEAKREGKPT